MLVRAPCDRRVDTIASQDVPPVSCRCAAVRTKTISEMTVSWPKSSVLSVGWTSQAPVPVGYTPPADTPSRKESYMVT